MMVLTTMRMHWTTNNGTPLSNINIYIRQVPCAPIYGKVLLALDNDASWRHCDSPYFWHSMVTLARESCSALARTPHYWIKVIEIYKEANSQLQILNFCISISKRYLYLWINICHWTSDEPIKFEFPLELLLECLTFFALLLVRIIYTDHRWCSELEQI